MGFTQMWGSLVCNLAVYLCVPKNGQPIIPYTATTPGPAIFNGQFTHKSQPQLASWSWQNQGGIYEAYMHGDNYPVSRYIRVSEQYGRKGIASYGARFIIDETSHWQNSTNAQTEIMPILPGNLTVDNNYQQGVVVYHWSVAFGLEPDMAKLSTDYDHSLVYFDASFAALKYGTIDGFIAPGKEQWLQFFIAGKLVWLSEVTSGRWHNFALAVDYTNRTAELHFSLGKAPLTKVVDKMEAPVNRARWHIGILRKPLEESGKQLSTPTGLYYSLIWIEKGQVTAPMVAPGTDVSVAQEAKAKSGKAKPKG